jgi:hypothetical protein
MKPSSWDKQLGLASPRECAASQSNQTNNPSENEVGLDVSHHTRIFPRGEEKFLLLTSFFIGSHVVRGGAQDHPGGWGTGRLGGRDGWGAAATASSTAFGSDAPPADQCGRRARVLNLRLGKSHPHIRTERLRVAGVVAVVLGLLGGTTWLSGGFWARTALIRGLFRRSSSCCG